jgi:hypothetical protein
MSASYGSYRAHKTRTLLSPVPNVAGVASDDTGLWILSHSYDEPYYVVVHYDLSSGVITDRFPLPDLFQTLGYGADGIEVDAQSIWISVAGDSNAIVRLDRQTGQVAEQFGSPSTYGPSDLAWLGADLMVSTGSGELYALSLTPPIEQRGFTSFVPQGSRDSGVATCNGMVVWGNLFGGINVLSASGVAVGEIVDEGGQTWDESTVGSLCFYGNELVIADAAGLEFYSLQADPSSALAPSG